MLARAKRVALNWMVRLTHRQSTWIALLIVNAAGVFFGLAWYKGQLARSFWWFWPAIPDSPLSALLFIGALLAGLYARQTWVRAMALTPYLMATASAWLIQYGIWCVGVLGWESSLSLLPLEGWVLLAIHAGMAIEGAAVPELAPRLRFRHRHVAVAVASLYLHDFVDYVYNVFPFVPRVTMVPLVAALTPILTTVIGVYLWRRCSAWARLAAQGDPWPGPTYHTKTSHQSPVNAKTLRRARRAPR